MKVLLINNFHYRKGGSEAVYFNTAEVLKKHGHEVIFFSYKDKQNIPCKQSDFFVTRKGMIGTIKDYFYNTEAEKKLEQLLLEEHPDIAHIHLFWGGLSVSILRALHKYNIPIVHTAHDYRMVCPGYTFKNGKGALCEKCHHWNFYQCVFNQCAKRSLVQSILMTSEMYSRQLFFNPLKNINGFVFVSHFSEKKHIEHNEGFNNAIEMVIYNYTKPLLKPCKKEKKDYFLYYGRLSFEKGIPTLLKVFAKHPELQLKVVGTGPLEKMLKMKYKNAPAGASLGTEYNENIQFLGYHSGDTLFELVRNAKFVCVPSECYENNPMTIIEAYSLGTPVIGANIGGIPEIVQEDNTGWLFETGNEESLEQTIVKASKIDDEKYDDMCENAYSFYEDNFSEDVHYKKLIQLYNLIINNKK